MRVTAIYGCNSDNTVNYNSNNVSTIIYNTIKEIGISLDEINLVEKNIPFLNSSTPNINIANIMNSIDNSNGVIFIFNTHISSPSALMQNFLDYFSLPMYKDVLKNKNCFIITIYNGIGKQTSLNYFSDVVQSLGGFDSIRIGLSKEISSNIITNINYKELLEKYVEDFYRYISQGRNFFVSSDKDFTSNENLTSEIVKNTNNIDYNDNINDNIYSPRTSSALQPENTMSSTEQRNENYVNSNFTYNKNQEQRIPNDISNQDLINPKRTRYISNPYVNDKKVVRHNLHQTSKLSNIYNTSNSSNLTMTNVNNPNKDYSPNTIDEDNAFLNNILGDDNSSLMSVENNLNKTEESKYFNQNNTVPKDAVINEELYPVPPQNMVPRNVTVKQMMQSLVHYYQPQLAKGLVGDLQLNVTGDETFNCFIRINNSQCNYFDGWSDNPGVTITGTSLLWKRVLKGDLTSQRAFMTGQLKVRGNFMLLSKFDQLFKF